MVERSSVDLAGSRSVRRSITPKFIAPKSESEVEMQDKIVEQQHLLDMLQVGAVGQGAEARI